MSDVNHVILIGRLTRDAELKYTAGGYPISNFAIAVNRRKKSGDQWVDEVSYFDITLFGKSAEALKQYLVKGKQVAVEGELRQDRWEQDGQPRSKVVIVANNVQLLGGGQSTGGSGPAQSGYPPQGAPAQRYSPPQGDPPQTQDPPRQGGYEDDFEDDIPF
ncbi:MAG: single-stranded DNA-binding protein [Spirochaetaceae bacterium]|jgi:single-strand DNA-binding protein|nr:single-stranded DNA-binding protein [Spirochaetaceae bacterium]